MEMILTHKREHLSCQNFLSVLYSCFFTDPMCKKAIAIYVFVFDTLGTLF